MRIEEQASGDVRVSLSRLIPLIAVLIAVLNMVAFGVTWWRVGIFLVAYIMTVATSMGTHNGLDA